MRQRIVISRTIPWNSFSFKSRSLKNSPSTLYKASNSVILVVKFKQFSLFVHCRTEQSLTE